jgi:hypothetical protein
MIFNASSFITNGNGQVERRDLIEYDAYNCTSGRKHICREVNRMLSKGLKGEVRVIDENNKVLQIVSVA